MPAGGSCCNRLKSRISLFLDGVDMTYGAPPRGPPAAPRRQGPEAPERARTGCGDAKACPACAIRSARVCENNDDDDGQEEEGRGYGCLWGMVVGGTHDEAGACVSYGKRLPRLAASSVN